MRIDKGASNLRGLAERPVVGRRPIFKVPRSWGAWSGETRDVHLDNLTPWSTVPDPGADGKVAARVAAEEIELLAHRVTSDGRSASR
jgi:hypothetical protein